MSRQTVIYLLNRPCRSILYGADVLHHLPLASNPLHRLRTSLNRHASSTAAPPFSRKPLVLDKPDKFRPPSHPSRLTARRGTPPQYPGPPLPQAEKQAQAARKYPHMFPNEGTWMHWFLTNRIVHVYISLGTLTLLSLITLTQSFLTTSPFAKHAPPLSTFITDPIGYITSWGNIINLHMANETDKVAEKRWQRMIDAQKCRLYRRANGMEDLENGPAGAVDVQGLVSWDDGLTNRERRQYQAEREEWEQQRALRRANRQGQLQAVVTAAETWEGGQPVVQSRVLRVKNGDEGKDGRSPVTAATMEVGTGVGEVGAMGGPSIAAPGEEENVVVERPARRPLKKWLGIW